jgi:hypothetical protein
MGAVRRAALGDDVEFHPWFLDVIDDKAIVHESDELG